MGEVDELNHELMEMERQADLFIMRREVTDLRKAFIEGWQECSTYRDELEAESSVDDIAKRVFQ